MSTLPLLVTHGAILAKVFVAGLTLAKLGTVQLVRKRRANVRARDEARRRTAGANDPHPGPVVLRARYRGTHLECTNGTRVELAGGPRIVLGTRARWRWRAPEPIATLADGDEVIAHGTLEHRDPDPLARVPVHEWTLSAAELCALSPRTALRPLGPLRWAAAVA